MPNPQEGGGIIHFDYTDSAAENFYFAEATSFQITVATTAETIYLAENLTKVGSFVRAQESVYLSEMITFGLTFSLAENIYLAESMSKVGSFNRAASENIFISEAMGKKADFVRASSEDLYLSETFNYVHPTGVFERIYLAENMSKIGSFVRSQADDIYLEEVASVQTRMRAYPENVSLSEIFNTKSFFGRSFSDDVFISESKLEFDTGKALADEVYLADSTPQWDVSQVASSSVYIHEILAYQLGDRHWEDFVLRERIAKKTTQKPVGENVYLAEVLHKTPKKRGADVFYVAEAKTQKTLKTLRDNAYLAERLRKRISMASYDEDIFLLEHEHVKPWKRFREDAYLLEAFSYEHNTETISSFDHPSITEIKSIPVMATVLGFQGKGGHA